MLENELAKINEKANSFFHLELAVFSYSFPTRELIIAGSEDFAYYHNFEIKFRSVFSMIVNSDWIVNTAECIIELVTDLNELRAINLKYRVEIGNNIFKLKNEDNLDFYVIAESVELVDKVVKYQ
jgi:hypothetical protein